MKSTIIPSVVFKSKISTGNSTQQELAIGGVFTGEWEDVTQYAEVIVSIYATENSATDGLVVQWSSDASVVHSVDTFTISASSSKTFTFPCQNKYIRIVYTNNGTVQMNFDLQTLLKVRASRGSSHRLKDSLSQEDDATVTKALIAGLSSQGGGTIHDVKVTPAGALATDGEMNIRNSSDVVINPATEDTLATIAEAVHTEDTAHASGDRGMALLGIRSDNDTFTADEGDYTVLKLDEQGRLKVSSKPASYPDITGDITAIQATIGTPVAGGTVEGDVSRASNLMIFCTGTFAGVNCTFEGSLELSGNTNWFAVQAIHTNANTIETTTGALSAQPAYAWEASVNALKRFRVRATARTSGTQSWRFVQGTYATEPIPGAQVTATQPVSGTLGVARATLAIPTTVADVASAALTTTTTTAAITPAAGVAYTVNVSVTAVGGTNPTLDIAIEEADDTGTNWRRVYEFPRITATGFYASQPILLQGNRLRYVQTVAGTTPSFTRAVNRLQRQDGAITTYRQRFDRTLVINTLNSTGLVLETLGAQNLQMTLNLGAGGTAPSIQLQGSDDNINWYNIGSPLAGTVSDTVQTTIVDISPKFIRPKVSTAGSGATLGYVLLKAF